MRRALAWAFAPIAAHRRALLVLNLLYFGALLVGIVYTAIDPQLHQMLLEAVGEAFSPTGELGPLVEAYQTGQLVIATVLTFLVNLFLGSALYITLPSLLIPFAGVGMGLLRGVLWGLLFSPLTGTFDLAFAPHVLTILIEGEAYVIAMLGVWLWWWPVFSRSGGRFQAWADGLRLQGRIYVAVALVLAIAAIYEALEAIYVIPRLAGT